MISNFLPVKSCKLPKLSLVSLILAVFKDGPINTKDIHFLTTHALVTLVSIVYSDSDSKESVNKGIIIISCTVTLPNKLRVIDCGTI